MKRVLVTGASGFIGRQALPYLCADGYEVHAVGLSNVLATSDEDKMTWHAVDLLDSQAVDQLMATVQPSHLLHLGWYAVPGKYMTSAVNADWVKASINIMSSFVHHGGTRFVGAGTCIEYDTSFGFCTEQHTPIQANSFYGNCKNATHLVLQSLAQAHELELAWGRVFFIYGPHEHPKRLVSSVIHSLLNQQDADCSPGTQIRDFMHVEDVAGSFVALLNSPVTGPVNVCSGQAVSIRQVVEVVADQLDAHKRINFGAFPLNPSEPPLLVGNAGRLHNEVGFSPRYGLSDGLAHTIDWWRSRLKSKG